MKRCPNCQKEFPDSMRFCQTDGTPLLDVAEQAQDDPFKTVVGQPQDDPFKTVVGGGMQHDSAKDDDILQLPEEPLDPMKTMVVSPGDLRSDELSSTPFNAAPPDLPTPPQFKEPDLNPPVFGDLSPKPSSSSDILGSSGGSSSTSDSGANEPKPFDPPSQSPFGQPPSSSPFQSPFEQPKSSFEPSSSPFDAPPTPQPQSAPPSPFDASPAQQPPPFKEPDSPFSPPSMQQNQNPFGGGSQPGNDPFAQPQGEWNPPPAPVQSWQDQGLGANTPFQPPATGTGGQNQTLPIISLILGIVSLCCYISPLTGLAAVITGFLGMKNANSDPANYGGKTLAIIGMILGGLLFLVGIVYYVLIIIGFAAGGFPR